eukprot:1959450-Rhodomonas_salina.3
MEGTESHETRTATGSPDPFIMNGGIPALVTPLPLRPSHRPPLASNVSSPVTSPSSSRFRAAESDPAYGDRDPPFSPNARRVLGFRNLEMALSWPPPPLALAMFRAMPAIINCVAVAPMKPSASLIVRSSSFQLHTPDTTLPPSDTTQDLKPSKGARARAGWYLPSPFVGPLPASPPGP